MNDRVDIAVVGAGAAGIAAAITAARAGRSVWLLDQRPAAGGTGGFSGLTTLCGLYDDAGHFLNDGFAREFAEAIAGTAPVKMGRLWVLPYLPERFRSAAVGMLAAMPGLRTDWNTRVTEVICEGGCIASLNGRPVNAVIDASGTAEVARALGLECLATDESTQAPAVVFALKGVSRNLSAAPDAVQVLLALARAGLPPVSFQPHPGFETVTVKLAGTSDQAQGVVDFLRANVQGFENSSAGAASFVSSARAGRMIAGRTVLTGADVLAGRKFAGAAARGAWPIEQWNARGISRCRYLPAGTYYEIPEDALRAVRIGNLFMAGKTISADADAMASARVMGTCLATGAAAGKLAAALVESMVIH